MEMMWEGRKTKRAFERQNELIVNAIRHWEKGQTDGFLYQALYKKFRGPESLLF